MKKCVMIYNKNSGKVKTDDLIPLFETIMTENGYSLEVQYTKSKGHATTLVKELPNDIDLVIAAGGDGTFNEVVNGDLLREKKLLIANLPLGTTNDVANMYGYHSDIVENLKILLDGDIKNIDICKINNNAFVYFAGIGNFVNVTYDTPRKLKKKYGRTAYIIYALKEFAGKLKRYNIKYEIDGKIYDGNYTFVFITNSSTVAGVSDIYTDVKLDDNMFEVLFCDIKTKFTMLRTLSMLKRKDIKTIPNLTYYRTNNLKVIFDTDLEESWCIDGERMNHNDNEFNFCVTKEINVLMPKANIDKLFL